jgi:DNA repair protein RecO (recombination protein O)
MPLKQSEAIVLRSYPLREADLLVTFFTRQEGKVRGVARSAKRSKRRFGGALEPLTHVVLHWDDRERQELGRIDSCEVLESPLSNEVDYPRAVALGHVAEVIDEMMPDREANDALFRLAVTTLGAMQAGAVWMPVTYFDLWVARLTGVLPELNACIVCGEVLDYPNKPNAGLSGTPKRANGERAYFHPLADGLMCASDKRLASQEMSAESRRIAAAMFRAPIASFNGAPWPRQQAADLRKFVIGLIERHLEKKLVTAAMLDRLE